MTNKLTRQTLCILSCALLMLAPTGCKTLKAVYNAGTIEVSTATADQLIVQAENTAEIGRDSFNTFVHLEKDHRTAYAQISPKIHEFSAWLRFRVADPTAPPGSDVVPIPRGEAILKALRHETQIFAANRTPENRANLITAWKAVQAAIADCKKLTSLATGG